jgi:hypothetical protein
MIELNNQEKEEESNATIDSSSELNYAEFCYKGGEFFVGEMSRNVGSNDPVNETYGFNEALLLHKKALSIREKNFGWNNYKTAESYEAVADLLVSKNDFKASKKMYRQARKVFQD